MASVKEFSVEEKLVGLLTLQIIDSKIDEIQTLKGELPIEVKDLEDEIEGMRVRIQNIDTEINTMNEFISNKTEAKKDATALIKKYEKQQESVKNNLEMQELELKLCDKHIKDANFDIREHQAARVKAEEKISVLEEALTSKKAELERIIIDTEKEEKELEADADAAREKVDPRMLTAYERIRKSYVNGLAVVPVLRDSCGGCFNVIPPQRQSEIRQRKKILVCEHCGRILVDNDLNDETRAANA
jgi:hypothetical protein